jgi:hypothetical protein
MHWNSVASTDPNSNVVVQTDRPGNASLVSNDGLSFIAVRELGAANGIYAGRLFKT